MFCSSLSLRGGLCRTGLYHGGWHDIFWRQLHRCLANPLGVNEEVEEEKDLELSEEAATTAAEAGAGRAG